MDKLTQVELHWNMFRFDEIDTNQHYLKNHRGIYLWIIETSPPRIKYVGQTQISFYDRTFKHISMLVSGQYTVLGNIDYCQDFTDYLQKITSCTDIETLVKDGFIVSYPPPANIADVASLERIKKSLNYLSHMRFAFADLSSYDKNIAEEIEYIFIKSLSDEYKQSCGCDIRLPGQKSGNTILGKMSRKPTRSYTFNHTNAATLPTEIFKINSHKAG